MEMLSRGEISQLLANWQEAWNEHDLDRVMDLFHNEVVFENWTGARIAGKGALRRAWAPWFSDNGGFRFTEEELFVDEVAQKALFRWRLEWPSRENEGRRERRRGVDIIHFQDGKIVQKLTYSKTTVEMDDGGDLA